VSGKVMGKQNWLRMLEVGPSRHGCSHVFLRLAAEGLDVFEELGFKGVCGIDHKHSNQCGDLIVTAAPGPDLAPNVAPGNFYQASLKGCVNIFFLRLGFETSALYSLG
jgi:hypothetical protein